MMDIISVAKAMGGERRLKVLNLLSQKGNISAKEILSELNSDIYSQYLYSDLKILRKAGLITREYSEDIRGFLYNIYQKKFVVDLEKLSIDVNDENE